MEYGVYLESSIVDLKPKVLEFLTRIVEKAKEAKDYAISFKKKDIAEFTGKDVRTTSRYLNELEEKNIIQMKGVRGRSGGTVIMFNAELIRFDTSDKAFINSEEPISIDDIVAQKLPKKKPEAPKDNKRNRRTKQQMIEAKVLKNERQLTLDRLNDEVLSLGGVPNWAWFKKTDSPVNNYRTYLLSRLYNRYAALFTDEKNAEAQNGEGNPVQVISDNYDVLPERFFGSSRWSQFEKFRLFCEENDIDPAVYLSAQFNRSVFTGANKGGKKILPFTNALISEGSVDVYKQYCKFNSSKWSHLYQSHGIIPIKFGDDFVVRSIREAYESAEHEQGYLQYRYAFDDFLQGTGSDEKEWALLDFYRMTEQNLRDKKVSVKTRDLIKKFVLTQSLTQTRGGTGLPNYVILGLETTQVLLASIEKQVTDKKTAVQLKKRALGALVAPHLSSDEQLKQGAKLKYQYDTMYQTPKILQLIGERKGTALPLKELNAAFKEYGKDKIPVDDFSMMDIDKVIDFVKSEVGAVDQPQVIDHADITDTSTAENKWQLTGAIQEVSDVDTMFEDFLKN